MAIAKEGQTFVFGLEPKTANGHVANYQHGSVQCLSDNPDVVSVRSNPDNELEIEATVLDGSIEQAVIIRASVDGDPSENERLLPAVGTITVLKGDAAVLELKEIGIKEAAPVETGEQETPAEAGDESNGEESTEEKTDTADDSSEA